ncbi:hypothetical protein [Stenotrophomonas rhizophila]
MLNKKTPAKAGVFSCAVDFPTRIGEHALFFSNALLKQELQGMKDISGMIGFHGSGSPVAKLRPVVQSWMEILSTYSRRNTNDALWWYNERATLSSLAGAAWRMTSGRWMAIEEFSSTKRTRARANAVPVGDEISSHGGVESGSVSPGRVDLLLTNGRSNFAIEAKQAWQPIGRESTDRGLHVVRAMKAAWKDAGHLMLDEGDHRLACTFVVPYIAPGVADRAGDVTSLVEGWLAEEVWGSVPDGVAYHFPGTTRNLRSVREYVYPGVVLLIKERKKAVKQQRSNQL